MPDLVALAHHPADEHLDQAQQQQEPVVLDRLGQEHLDQLQVDQPVRQRPAASGSRS